MKIRGQVAWNAAVAVPFAIGSCVPKQLLLVLWQRPAQSPAAGISKGIMPVMHLLQDYSMVVLFKRQISLPCRRDYFRTFRFYVWGNEVVLPVLPVGKGGCMEQGRDISQPWCLRARGFASTADCGWGPLRWFNKNKDGLSRSLRFLEWLEMSPGCIESAVAMEHWLLSPDTLEGNSQTWELSSVLTPNTLAVILRYWASTSLMGWEQGLDFILSCCSTFSRVFPRSKRLWKERERIPACPASFWGSRGLSGIRLCDQCSSVQGCILGDCPGPWGQVQGANLETCCFLKIITEERL